MNEQKMLSKVMSRLGRKGAKAQKHNVSPEQLAAWGRKGVKAREESPRWQKWKNRKKKKDAA